MPDWPDIESLSLEDRAFLEVLADLYVRLERIKIMLPAPRHLAAIAGMQRALVELAASGAWRGDPSGVTPPA